MFRAHVDDMTTSGRQVEILARRDEHEPGYVQVATHPVSASGEFVHLDSDGIDQLVHDLQQAKQDAYGEPPRQVVQEPHGEAV